ncbi:hypothetical protein AN958_06338 [Leucoagaricus sp. SymC.cos]|nr:hypothetical protein AN958_06338 [Leucoagaricus sp. SymC.cos]
MNPFSSTSLFGRDIPECLKQGRYRTTPQIVWTCLATIFACTWVVIHPNLPGPYDSGFQRFRRRITIALVTIIAPELIAIWAARQLDSARKIKDEFNEKFNNGMKGWTLTHGFFIQMVGFMMYHEDKPVKVLTFKRLLAATIMDKSKGDWLTKLVVVLQITWFVAQCTGRASMRLPLAELEVSTLAFAVLNAYVYFFLWWSKPQGVLVPIRLSYKATPTSPFPSSSSSLSSSSSPDRGRETKSMDNNLKYQVGKTRVPMFYDELDHVWESKIVIFSLFVVPLVFGGIHLTLWSTSFHTLFEQLLWRISAIFITVVPLASIGLLFLAGRAREVNHVLFQVFFSVATVLVAFCLAIGYPTFRFILLVISFYPLTHLSEGAYHNIQWLDFFPHM